MINLTRWWLALRVAKDQKQRLAGRVGRHFVPWAVISFQERGADAHGLRVTADRQKSIPYLLAVVHDGGLEGHAPSVLLVLVVGELRLGDKVLQ